MLVYIERMAWRMLAAIAYHRPSLAVLAFAATLAVSAATNDWPAVSSSPHLNGLIGRLSNQPCCHTGQKGVHAVNLTSHQTILDVHGDTLVILS
jgi:hypothetical protein